MELTVWIWPSSISRIVTPATSSLSPPKKTGGGLASVAARAAPAPSGRRRRHAIGAIERKRRLGRLARGNWKLIKHGTDLCDEIMRMIDEALTARGGEPSSRLPDAADDEPTDSSVSVPAAA